MLINCLIGSVFIGSAAKSMASLISSIHFLNLLSLFLIEIAAFLKAEYW
ncbi:Uncharacterised protein, partial [Mycoplasmopsis synoviae]